MRKHVALAAVAGGFVLGFSGAAQAAAGGPFSLSLSAGAKYDDNVTVDATDQTSNKSDESAIIEGSVGYKFVNSESLKLEAGYDFYQSLHNDLSDFDLQIHGLSLSASSNIGNGVEVGASYRFNHILLGGSSFLDMHSVRPNINFTLGKLRLNTAYEYQHRNFKELDPRDADHHAFGAMAYFSPTKATRLNVGYKLVRENAVGPEFDFWGHYFDAGVKVKVPMPGVEPTFRASYRYFKKDFSNITPSIGAKRDDKRHTIKTSIEAPIVAGVTGKLQYEYIKSISNLPSVDYPENLVTFTLGWSL